MTETEEVVHVLDATDRCDACGSQAYVKATGVTGDLLFCAHHFGKIENDAVASEKMSNFAFELIDERDKLIENRLKGDD